MIYFPDCGERENVNSLVVYSVFYFFTVHIFRFVFVTQSLGIGGIYMPLFQTGLKLYFYLLHYLFVHLSTEYFIWIRFI